MTTKVTGRRKRVRHVRIEIGPTHLLMRGRPRWRVRCAWNQCAWSKLGVDFPRRRDALAFARAYARSQYALTGRCFSIRLKNRNGRYADEITIPRSSDPFPPRG